MPLNEVIKVINHPLNAHGNDQLQHHDTGCLDAKLAHRTCAHYAVIAQCWSILLEACIGINYSIS